jgi:hypothetical protein
MATAVRITCPDGKVSFSAPILVQSADKQTEAGQGVFAVQIHRELCKLFTQGFAQIDWESRRALMKQPLAQWLQLYFSRFPKPISVRELHRLSGSGSRSIFHFRANLKVAIGELVRAGVLTDWRLEPQNDVIHVVLAGKAPPEPGGRPGALPADAQGTLPLPKTLRVSTKAQATFAERYPDLDCATCLSDWMKWLADTGRSARRPDAAFLGFAKTWVAARTGT